MKILYAASEARPFAASGGLADVAGSLPGALKAEGVECRVVMPLYSQIANELRDTMRFVKSINVALGWRNQYCGIFEAEKNSVIYYLLDNEYYFKREGLYGQFDDAERFAFFSKAVPEVLTTIDFEPDIIHCNDWQTAMIPVFLNTFYRGLDKLRTVRTVFTIHNIQYQGKYGMEVAGDICGLPEEVHSIVEWCGAMNMMKGAIAQADMVTTVSPTYAEEILDSWYGFGLEELLREETGKLHGILNGIDVDSYNPATDTEIFHTYSAKTSKTGKARNKAALQKLMKLDEEPDRPLVAMVTRLVAMKGLDLVQYIFEELLALGVQVVMLGSGDKSYEDFFEAMALQHPGVVAIYRGFRPDLARKIYAGADLFLMPSQSEPCGLSQMIALRYGTIPVVRATGGLKDSITDLGGPNGNGFVFQSYNAHDMLGALQRGVELYRNRDSWQKAVKGAMAQDYSWERSAREYVALYKKVLE